MVDQDNQTPDLSGLDPVIAKAEQVENTGAGDTGGDDTALEMTTADLLAGILSPLFGLFAPGWRVTEKECSILAGAWGPVVDKYFPGLDVGVEFQAVLITAAIFAPRAGQPMRIIVQETPSDATEK